MIWLLLIAGAGLALAAAASTEPVKATFVGPDGDDAGGGLQPAEEALHSKRFEFEDPNPTSEQLVGPLNMKVSPGDRIWLKATWTTTREHGEALPGAGEQRCHGRVWTFEYEVLAWYEAAKRFSLRELDREQQGAPGDCRKLVLHDWRGWPAELQWQTDLSRPGFYFRYPWQNIEVAGAGGAKTMRSLPYTLKISWRVTRG